MFVVVLHAVTVAVWAANPVRPVLSDEPLLRGVVVRELGEHCSQRHPLAVVLAGSVVRAVLQE